MSYCRISEWELDDGIKSIKSAWQREYMARANLEKMLENAEAENAKLRDAMYAKAGKHALQHMDEDELRIWATQQAEHIEELRELCSAMLRYILPSGEHHTLKESMAIVDDFADRCEELGIGVES